MTKPNFNPTPNSIPASRCAKRQLSEGVDLPLDPLSLAHHALGFLNEVQSSTKFVDGGVKQVGVYATCVACDAEVRLCEDVLKPGGRVVVQLPGGAQCAKDGQEV
jgi:hypothetical protein